jgi:hypothetical protein
MGSEPSGSRNWHYIIHLANCPSPNSPTDFSDEPEKVLEHAGKVAKLMTAAGSASSPGPPVNVRITEAVGAAMRELDSVLGPEIARKVRLHVTEYVKTKIRYVRPDIPYPAK